MRESEERNASILSRRWTGHTIIRGRVLNSIQPRENTLATNVTSAWQLFSDLIIPPMLRERHRRGLARYLCTGRARRWASASN